MITKKPLISKNVTLPEELITEVSDLSEFIKRCGHESNFSAVVRKCLEVGLIQVADYYEGLGIMNGRIKKEELE